MTGSREWGPTGISPPVANPVTLSDENWNEACEIFMCHTGRDAPPKLRAALNDASKLYQSVNQGLQPRTGAGRNKHVSAPATPKQIRGNLKRAIEAQLRYIQRLNEIDGNSRQLIGEVKENGLAELFDHARQDRSVLSAAEALSRDFATSRSGMIDYAARDMGFILARAVRRFAGEAKLTATRDGLYHQLLLLLFRVLGEPSENRSETMRRALDHARERRREGTEGPLLDWEQPDDMAT